MEVKINREIRDYTESMFFGLSLRQLIFSLLAILVALGIYFILKPYLGTETVSWMCIVGAAPFAALGFIKYNGMRLEQLIWAWLRSEFITPKKLIFRSDNLYYNILKPILETPQGLPFGKGKCYGVSDSFRLRRGKYSEVRNDDKGRERK